MVTIAALAGCGAYEANGALQARSLRDQLLRAKVEEAPTIVNAMAPFTL